MATAKRKEQIKVSGLVGPREHERLTALAKEGHTTIGAIVRYAVRQALAELARNPDAIAALEPDARPENNRRMHRLRKRAAA